MVALSSVWLTRCCPTPGPVSTWMGDRRQAGGSPRYVTSRPRQPSPPWVGAMSTSDSSGVNRHTARCSLAACPWFRGVKLMSLIPELKKRRSAPLYGSGSRRTLRLYLTMLMSHIHPTQHRCLLPCTLVNQGTNTISRPWMHVLLVIKQNVNTWSVFILHTA